MKVTEEEVKEIFSLILSKSEQVSTGHDKKNYRLYKDKKFREYDEKYVCDNINNCSYFLVPYREQLILKNKLSLPRVLSIPTIRDKVFLKLLDIEIKKHTSLKNIAMKNPQACIAKLKWYLENKLLLEEEINIIKLDISNFYSSINILMLIKELEKVINDKELIIHVKNAVENPTLPYGYLKNERIKREKGIPQGAAISPILAEIYLHELDSKIKNFFDDALYIRFADDVLFITSRLEEIDEFEILFKYELDLIDLELNEKKRKKTEKFNETGEKFIFLGYSFFTKGEKLNIGPKLSNLTKHERRIEIAFSRFRKHKSITTLIWQLNIIISGGFIGDNGENIPYGWVKYFLKMNNTGYLHHLDELVEKIADRYKIYNKLRKNRFIKLKSFVKTYYELKKQREITTEPDGTERARYTGKYVPQFDDFEVKKKRLILDIVYNIKKDTLSSMNDDEVSRIFKHKVFNELKSLEKDYDNEIY